MTVSGLSPKMNSSSASMIAAFAPDSLNVQRPAEMKIKKSKFGAFVGPRCDVMEKNEIIDFRRVLIAFANALNNDPVVRVGDHRKYEFLGRLCRRVTRGVTKCE